MSDKRFVLANSRAEWTRIDLLMLPHLPPKWLMKPKQTNLLENCCFFLSHFKKKPSVFFPRVFQWIFLYPLVLLAKFLRFRIVFSFLLCFVSPFRQGLPIRVKLLIAEFWGPGTNPPARYLDVTSAIFPLEKKWNTKPTRLVLHQLGSDGPMVELPGFNWPTFAEAEHQELRVQGLWLHQNLEFCWKYRQIEQEVIPGRKVCKERSLRYICKATDSYLWINKCLTYCSQRCSLQWHLVHLCAWSAFFTWTLKLAACSHATRKVLFRIM